MRILYFSETYSVHDHRFLSSLASTQHEVYFLRLLEDKIDMAPISGLKNIHIAESLGLTREQTFFDLLKAAKSLKPILHRIQPDLVHAGPLQNCAFVASIASNKPLLAMSWGFDLMDIIERKWIWKLTTIFALNKAAYYTSDAQATQHRAFQLGAKKNRASLIPWGVDCERFSPQPRETAVGQGQLFTLFCNRSWEPTYGVDVLAKAFCKVASTRSDVRLMLLGSGSMEEKIKGILSDGKVLDKVLFPGRISQEELANYYRKADLYISPSHVDGSSVSLMEALACGLPVLVSDIPGNLPWVQEKMNGWSFRDNDVDMLANKILSAIGERESLHEMGENARQLALEKANWKINFQALLQTYEDTLSAEKRDN